MSQKTLLIVGGAGFIGSYVNKILKSHYRTLILDDLSQGFAENALGTQLIVANAGNKEVLKEIFAKHPIDAVLHFAALTGVGASTTEPGKYYQNNVVHTLTLLDTMVECGIPYFLFSSSAAIYGIPEQHKITEDHPAHPINPYGQTKWIVEQILRDYRRAYGLKSCSLRYFNAAGGDPEGRLRLHVEKMSNLIPVLIRCVQEECPVHIYGNDYPTRDGTCVRDYVHVHDLATAHLLALEYLLSGGSIPAFNLGNGEGFSVKEVIDTASQVFGRPIPCVLSPRRPGDPPTLLADASLAKRELHWEPMYPELKTIVDHAWRARL